MDVKYFQRLNQFLFACVGLTSVLLALPGDCRILYYNQLILFVKLIYFEHRYIFWNGQ